MARRQKEPHAKHPVAVEYYDNLTKRFVSRGFCKSPENAYVKAGEHLDRGHAIMAVGVMRQSGRTLWTRLKIGKHNITRAGDAPNEPSQLRIDVPAYRPKGDR